MLITLVYLLCCQVILYVILTTLSARKACLAENRMLVFSTFDHRISVCRVSLYHRLHSLLPFSFFSRKLCGQGYYLYDYYYDLAQNTDVRNSHVVTVFSVKGQK